MNYFGIDKNYVQYLANITAQKQGFHIATEIIYKNCKKSYVLKFIQPGYRKFSDDSYVCNAYRNNFGWKNTYYQSAECTVVLPLRYKKIAERD